MRELQPRVVYLHGFNSSPASLKAKLVADHCKALRIEAVVPQLSYDPVLAMNAAQSCIMERELPALLIGSSLGGYYATWLAEKFGIKAALVNPAVSPCDHLHADFLGKRRNIYTGEEYEFTREHVKALRQYDVKTIRDPSRYLLLVQTGDEVLDYRLAVERYAGCRQIVQQGGNHSFENFAGQLPGIMQFAGLD
ncbi:MAG TPA: YqiA/YcfP family alpha/beta fold hydrolase [Candidatus Acidoferrum sp.]|nr:YqiA/YcfP family alpha/beta fold hydrolase [Candidatus Acidoferrum sp.]